MCMRSILCRILDPLGRNARGFEAGEGVVEGERCVSAKMGTSVDSCYVHAAF